MRLAWSFGSRGEVLKNGRFKGASIPPGEDANGSPDGGRRVRAASLGIVLEYYGRYVPLDVLRTDCGVSRDGSNAFYIKEAAKQYGLEVQAFRKPAAGLATKPPPMIVLWQWNHFLVVEGFARGKVHLNDPACGRRRVSREEFARGYSGIAFTFKPGPRFVRRGRRPSAFGGPGQSSGDIESARCSS